MDDVQYNELKKMVKGIADDQAKVNTFLIGQPEFKQHGLVDRMIAVEKHVKADKTKKAKAEGIRAVLAIIFGFIAGNIKAAWELITS